MSTIEPERSGTFITFEGPDGSGKSTQLRLLAQRLRSAEFEVIETQEPGGTAIGRKIRSILLNPENSALCPIAEMLLYFAARAQNFDELIWPAWKRGAVVLSDRYTDSTIAYQGHGRGLGKDVVMQLHNLACHEHLPDLTLIVDIDPEAGMARAEARAGGEGRRDRIEEAGLEFHRKVRAAYLALAAEDPQRIHIIDGGGSIETVSGRIWAVVEPVLATKRRLLHV